METRDDYVIDSDVTTGGGCDFVQFTIIQHSMGNAKHSFVHHQLFVTLFFFFSNPLGLNLRCADPIICSAGDDGAVWSLNGGALLALELNQRSQRDLTTTTRWAEQLAGTHTCRVT